MKKIVVVLSSFVLGGCVTSDLNNLSRSLGSLTNSGKREVTSSSFCEMKKADLNQTRRDLQGKIALPYGRVTAIQKQGNETVIGIEGNSNQGRNDTAYAKVKDTKGVKIGDYVEAQGVISEANFKDANNCYFLLDNAKITNR